MERRSFLKQARLALLPAPWPPGSRGRSAHHQVASGLGLSEDPGHHLRCHRNVARRVAAATGGKFQIRCSPPARSSHPRRPGRRQGRHRRDGHAASYYYVGKDPTLAFDTALPFGLNSRQQTAWMFDGGGMELMREFFKDYNIVNIPCGNTGTQMGGWFRKEIKTPTDLQGPQDASAALPARCWPAGRGAPADPPGDIYPALEKGTIDAAEWIGPYDDQKLGFNKVAKYYYYPGWWEGGPQLSIYVNAKTGPRCPRNTRPSSKMPAPTPTPKCRLPTMPRTRPP
jgi:TRAP-type mannitol/chloroaromatic compound transport system substrate-binding protein